MNTHPEKSNNPPPTPPHPSMHTHTHTHTHTRHTREMQVHKEHAVNQVLQVTVALMVTPAKLVHLVPVEET